MDANLFQKFLSSDVCLNLKRDNINVWQLPSDHGDTVWWYLEQISSVQVRWQRETTLESESWERQNQVILIIMRAREKIVPGPNEKITAYTSETDSRLTSEW